VRTLTRRRLLQAAGAAAASAALPRPAFGRQLNDSNGHWLAGDFHSHTVLSHDVWGGPGDDNTSTGDAYTLGWTAGEQIRNAETRELDFLAITDHNRTDALRLPEYRSDKLVLLPAYEHSLSGGHSGVFVPDKAALADIVREAGGGTAFAGDAGAQRFLDAVHGVGGIAVLNHPFYGNPNQGVELAWGYGPEVSSRFDAVEVWNIGWPARHDTTSIADSDNYLSLPWWESQIVPRRHIPALGGSDNHYRSTVAVQGVGQPTTWVYARKRTPEAILEGVRAGRTVITDEPPGLGGPSLHLAASERWHGGRREQTIGDEVAAAGPLDVFVRAHNSVGSRLRIVASGKVVAEDLVTSPVYSKRFPNLVLAEESWVRAELFVSAGYFMTALTSPIYAGDLAPAAVRRAASTGPAASYGDPSITAAVRSQAAATAVRQHHACGC
jgi:hypothetical protein